MNKISYTPSIIIKSTEYLGDHSREIEISITLTETTTIKELMEIVFEKGIKEDINTTKLFSKISDHIEIRCSHLQAKGGAE